MMNSSQHQTNASEIPYTQLPAYKVGFALDTYFQIATVVVAVLGNSATLFTITRMKPLTTVTISVAILAISDCFGISVKFMYTKLTYNGVPLSDAGCQLFNFLTSYLVDYANWVVVLMTSERFVAVKFPLHVGQILTKRRVALGYLVSAVLLLPSSLCAFWMYEEVHHDTFGTICYYKPNTERLVAIWDMVEMCIYAIVPCTTLILINSMLIYIMRTSSKRQVFGTEIQQRERRQMERQLTVMLLSAAIVFVILMMPIATFYAVRSSWNYRETEQSKATYYLVRSVVHLLADLNHAVNFFVYFLSGTKFRKTFFSLWPCWKTDKQNNSFISNTVSTKA